MYYINCSHRFSRLGDLWRLRRSTSRKAAALEPLPHHLARPLDRHNVAAATRRAAGHARRALFAGRQPDRGLVAGGGGGSPQARGVTVEVDEAAVERRAPAPRVPSRPVRPGRAPCAVTNGGRWPRLR
eukprot:scaffold5016_cov118-Isochrysis_galbana.AAC.6